MFQATSFCSLCYPIFSFIMLIPWRSLYNLSTIVPIFKNGKLFQFHEVGKQSSLKQSLLGSFVQFENIIVIERYSLIIPDY